MPALKVLITNAWLDGFGGTECTVRDLAFGLLRRGHRPIVYSPTIGKIGREIEAKGIAVIDDLRLLAEPPDIIHGQHFIPASEALIRFPQTPAIYVCHAWDYWVEQPPKFPQIGLYGAVSEAVRDRLVHTEGIPPQKVEIFFNSIDLTRIPTRVRGLSDRPKRALCFTAGKSHLPLLKEACDDLNVQLDLLGGCGDRFTSHPERELVEYDLVFATGRSAIEALCCGSAVVVCDERGFSGLVTSSSYEEHRRLNFALRTLTTPFTIENIKSAIDNYDAHDVVLVGKKTREEASLEGHLDGYIERYLSLLAAWPETRDSIPEKDVRTALFDFLQTALPRESDDPRWPWILERDELLNRCYRLNEALNIERALRIKREATVGLVLSSLSWRVTKPFRQLRLLTKGK